MNSNALRVMALDYGKKRVGVASTDETGRFALPRIVLVNDEELLGKIFKFIVDNAIAKVIIGESLNLEGVPNPIQTEIEEFRKRLIDKGIDVSSHPELLTTVEAKRLQGKTQMTDASAAALILKSYLDSVYNKDV